MALFNFGNKKELNKLQSEISELKKMASDANGFATMQLANMVNSIQPNIPVFPRQDVTTNVKRFITTDDIYSIIKLLMGKAASIPMYGYLKTPDKKAFNLLKEFKYQNPYLHKTLQKKALENLPEEDPLAMLLENPNEKISKYEFFESVYGFLFLSGEAFIKKERPDVGSNQGMPMQLSIWNPQGVTIKVTQSLPREVMAYDYRINGQLVFENVPAEDIIHIKYWNPEMTYNGDELRGLSPIKILHRRLTRVDKEMDISVAHLQNGGPRTIIYDESSGLEAVEISGKRKGNYYNFSSDPNNAGAPYFANGKMGAVQVGSVLADMGVTELAKIDMKGLCNAYNISDRLFNNDATGSEISDLNARKGMFTDAVIPNVLRVRDSLVKGLAGDFKNGVLLEEDGEPLRIPGDGKDRYIDPDISSITVLHEDIAKKVAQYANLPIMIPNMILEEMGFPTMPDDPMMDKVYIKAGYTPIDDMQSIPPIDTTVTIGNPGTGQ